MDNAAQLYRPIRALAFRQFHPCRPEGWIGRVDPQVIYRHAKLGIGAFPAAFLRSLEGHHEQAAVHLLAPVHSGRVLLADVAAFSEAHAIEPGQTITSNNALPCAVRRPA